jgi:hypothetical protein
MSFAVVTFAMKLLAEHCVLMKVQVAPPSRVTCISPLGSLDMTSPAGHDEVDWVEENAQKAIALDGVKLRGRACGDDQVRPASTLVCTSNGQLTPLAHGYVINQACWNHPVTSAMNVWFTLTELHVFPASCVTYATTPP